MTPFFRDTETDRLREEIIEVEVEAKTEDMEDQVKGGLLGFLKEIDLQRKGKIKNLIRLDLIIFLRFSPYILLSK